MKYEIKSILKSKASLVCLLIFLIINMLSMNFVNLKKDLEDNIISNEQLMIEVQSSVSNVNIIKRQLGQKIKPRQIEVLNNYEKYLNWKSENANEAIEYIKKEGSKLLRIMRKAKNTTYGIKFLKWIVLQKRMTS